MDKIKVGILGYGNLGEGAEHHGQPGGGSDEVCGYVPDGAQHYEDVHEYGVGSYGADQSSGIGNQD